MSVEFTVKDYVATIRINRPEAMNSLNFATMAALIDAFKRVQEDPEIRVGILTGAGDRAFCAGADLKEKPPEGSFAELTYGRPSDDSALSYKTDKPMIAAINGYAMGGGLELSLLCDIRIAADHARFGLPEAKIGSMPGAGGTQTLQRVVGTAHAMYMLMTAEPIDAPEAFRIGLVSKVVPLADLEAAANEIAAKIAANAPLSIRAIKKVVKLGREMPLEHALNMERFVWGTLRDTEDRAEGRAAFREKRKPNYRGK